MDEVFANSDHVGGSNSDRSRVHTYPLGKFHVVDGDRECWCRPKYERLCNECDGDGCTFCDMTGFVETGLSFEAEHVVHNDVEWWEAVPME